ncbi:hypothetical protein G7K_2103-t1 [Saitoella complicata NRRL Y-17804]|uniref:Uncharacterized protein n=1 Tax=Saitoella complicata (strain BCRC 22490 / CBS 7301 / JCM 7358 / NBRC 10748 / NRRL Y-17804) TaxID=698492 RepID=A0A0E9NDI3_SAICN|nr:hypothetical protein G7K_2103-t1 [Saitoella complicata NRRL Y-17804]
MTPRTRFRPGTHTLKFPEFLKKSDDVYNRSNCDQTLSIPGARLPKRVWALPQQKATALSQTTLYTLSTLSHQLQQRAFYPFLLGSKHAIEEHRDGYVIDTNTRLSSIASDHFAFGDSPSALTVNGSSVYSRQTCTVIGTTRSTPSSCTARSTAHPSTMAPLANGTARSVTEFMQLTAGRGRQAVPRLNCRAALCGPRATGSPGQRGSQGHVPHQVLHQNPGIPYMLRVISTPTGPTPIERIIVPRLIRRIDSPKHVYHTNTNTHSLVPSA